VKARDAARLVLWVATVAVVVVAVCDRRAPAPERPACIVVTAEPSPAAVELPVVREIEPVSVWPEVALDALAKASLFDGLALVDMAVHRVPEVLRHLTQREVPLVHARVAPSAARFLKAYRTYTTAMSHEPVPPSMRQAKAARRRTFARWRRAYHAAMAAADRHLDDFSSLMSGAPRRSYLLIHKSECLVYLVDEDRNEILGMFPAGVGILRGQKQKRGDLRTPECPPGRATVAATPFYVGPLVPDDPYPSGGVITRGIGVVSDDAAFDFLERGWLIMLHGTPDQESMGTRSSLGCVRMLPRHIERLYAHVLAGSRIVIVP
jgi:hypothetical protein